MTGHDTPAAAKLMVRRELIRRAAVLGLGATTLPLLNACGSDGGAAAGGGASTLNYFSWEPWARPEFLKPFEDAHNLKIKSAFYSSGSEMLTKLQAGGKNLYDMLSPVNSDIHQLAAAKLAIPFDTSKIPNFDQVIDPYRDHPDAVVDGKQYMIPFVWGSDAIAYNADKVSKEDAASWGVLFDPKYKGRIAVQDSAFQTLALTAIHLGYTDPSPYVLTDKQLEDVKKKCIEAKPLWRTLWSNFTDLQNLFIKEEVWAAQAWLVIVEPVRKENVNVQWSFVENDGAIGWFEGVSMVSSTKQQELLHEFANFCIGDRFMYDVFKATGYTPCSKLAGKNMTPEELEASRLERPELPTSLHYYKNPPNFAKWQQVWNEIKAA